MTILQRWMMKNEASQPTNTNREKALSGTAARKLQNTFKLISDTAGNLEKEL